MWQKFIAWYEKHRRIHVAIAAGLFTTQIVHLIWLTGNAVTPRLFDFQFFNADGAAQILIAAVDYLEIPAIVSASLLYILDFRKGLVWKSLLMLFFINSQWLHLFWITDEVVVTTLTDGIETWPAWLAWIAIFIDYLELPVIFDTLRQFFKGFDFKAFEKRE